MEVTMQGVLNKYSLKNNICQKLGHFLLNFLPATITTQLGSAVPFENVRNPPKVENG